jgi:hypothetical protein
MLSIAMTACTTKSCHYSTAKLSDVQVCNQLGSENMCTDDNPKLKVDETETVYITANMNNAPKNSKVKVTWYYLEEKDEEIFSNEYKFESAPKHLQFYLNAPDGIWPLGKYKAILDLGTDNTEPIEKEFEIVE